MADYDHLQSSPLNHDHHHNGHHVHTVDDDKSNESTSCCNMSLHNLSFLVNIFNFVLFFTAIIIITIVILYETPPYDDGSGSYLYLSIIRSLLPKSHPLNLLYYQLVVCGALICSIAAINIALDCYFSMAKEREKKSQPLNHEMEEIALTLTSNHDTTRSSIAPTSQPYHHHVPSMVLCLFIFTLLMLFTVQLCMVIFAFISVYGSTTSEGYKREFERSLVENLGEPEIALKARASIFDLLQPELKCCGIRNHQDYNLTLSGKDFQVPESCCKTRNRCDTLRTNPNNIWTKGCAGKMSDISGQHILLSGWLAFTLLIVELLALIFSCCFYVQLLSNYHARFAQRNGKPL